MWSCECSFAFTSNMRGWVHERLIDRCKAIVDRGPPAHGRRSAYRCGCAFTQHHAGEIPRREGVMRPASHARPSLKRQPKAATRRSSRTVKRHKAEPRQSAKNSDGDFSITFAKTQLHRALSSTRRNEFAMYRDLRDAGLTWVAICAWCDDPAEHGGKKISAFNWARDNAPISKRWLDEHARFARDWGEFVDCWKWAQKQVHTPDRRPSLRTARELMDAKKREDTYHSAISKTRSVVRTEPDTKGNFAATDNETVIVNPVTTILRGDVTDMMRKHRSDGSVDLVVGDPPVLYAGPRKSPRNQLHLREWRDDASIQSGLGRVSDARDV